MTRIFTTTGIILIALLLGTTFFVWTQILGVPLAPGFYFLDVGQGDSELVVLETGARVLIDAGPDNKVVKNLETVLPTTERYIDLGLISHPQLDHFGGYLDLLDRYDFGAIIINGRNESDRTDDPENAWQRLLKKIDARHIPLITLKAGDSVKNGGARLVFLGPDELTRQSGDLNDTVLVTRVESQGLRALFTGDIGASIETYLAKHADLRADILKVAHHGSKFSSSAGFLAAVQPKAAVIEVGRGNRFGHPTPEALARLSALGIQVFRTDEQGLIAMTLNGQDLRVRSLGP
ncbi:MAG TPA: MBL fold metallo-hydrolase [Candidatus Paceibacterota bacterium]|nr:MBL fold metallo-hydrolase [Candidatus Paceibacterota bacterium]